MDDRRLTLGQASLLVLSTSLNRTKNLESRKIPDSSSFDTTYESKSTLTPSFSPANTPQLKEKITPFKETECDKQSSPSIKVPKDEGVLFDYDELFDGSLSEEETTPNNNSNPNNDKNKSAANINYEDINDKPIVSKKRMLSFAKDIFSLHRPHIYRHDYMFVTADIQYKIITDHLNIGSISVSKLSSIITKDDFISFMSTYKGEKGRWLFVLVKPDRDLLASEINK